MKLIVITSPHFFEGEATLITDVLDKGVDVLHLRKPGSTAEQCAKLLDAIPERLHQKIVVHYHHNLCNKYALKGIHVSPMAKMALCKAIDDDGKSIRCIRSRSCHGFEEVVACKAGFDYLFLSPIFNSISKEGYSSAFTVDQLREASENRVIDERVVALGGVTADKIPLLRSLHFGGVALLGDVWDKAGNADFDSYIKTLVELCKR